MTFKSYSLLKVTHFWKLVISNFWKLLILQSKSQIKVRNVQVLKTTTFAHYKGLLLSSKTEFIFRVGAWCFLILIFLKKYHARKTGQTYTAHESLQKVSTPLCPNGAIGRVASLIAWWSRVQILPSSKYFCTFHEIKLYLESNYIKIFTKESMRKDNKNFLLYIHLLINAKFLVKTFSHSFASHFTVSVYMHFKGSINYGLFHENFFLKWSFLGVILCGESIVRISEA